MNISKKSWHYRFLEFFEKEIPDGLCAYVRTVFFTLILVTFMLSVIAFMSFISGAFILTQIGITSITPFDFIDVVLAAVLGIVTWTLIVLAVVAALIGGETLIEKKSNSLTVNFVKAKKSKICPRIEFKD